MADKIRIPLAPEALTELKEFCKPKANRYSLLLSSLQRRGIIGETLTIGEARHIVVPVSSTGTLDREYYRVTLVAHYDRVPGTPGANDNAAAVFQLLDHLEEIRSLGWHHRTQVLFTDKEEILGNAPATTQGSWALARELKRRKADNLLFFVLDMCGIGNIPIWGRSLKKAGLVPLHSAQATAYTVMESFLKRYSGGRSYDVNPLFSDDLGLLLGGYPALQLSLLPRAEANHLCEHLSTLSTDTDPEAPAKARDRMRTSLPPSWQANHGPEDTVETLSGEAFLLMARLLRDLARYRFPLPS